MPGACVEVDTEIADHGSTKKGHKTDPGATHCEIQHAQCLQLTETAERWPLCCEKTEFKSPFQGLSPCRAQLTAAQHGGSPQEALGQEGSQLVSPPISSATSIQATLPCRQA